LAVWIITVSLNSLVTCGAASKLSFRKEVRHFLSRNLSSYKNCKGFKDYTYLHPQAKVAELVDAHDSKSCILGCAGSIPAFGTSTLFIT
jgi:hypothetical protein